MKPNKHFFSIRCIKISKVFLSSSQKCNTSGLFIKLKMFCLFIHTLYFPSATTKNFVFFCFLKVIWLEMSIHQVIHFLFIWYTFENYIYTSCLFHYEIFNIPYFFETSDSIIIVRPAALFNCNSRYESK